MLHYTIIIEMNDGQIVSYDYSNGIYASKIYMEWKNNKDVRAGQLYNNWIKGTVCSFEK